jgi:hypothetical protein
MFSVMRLKKKMKKRRKMSWGALTMTFILRLRGVWLALEKKWRIVALKESSARSGGVGKD